MSKYYKITGMNEGVDITPFGTTIDSLDAALSCHGDCCRYYEEISFKEYLELEYPESAEELFSKIINLLLELKWPFMVSSRNMLSDDDPLLTYLTEHPEDSLDIGQFVYVQIGQLEWVVMDFDQETLRQLLHEIETFC